MLNLDFELQKICEKYGLAVNKKKRYRDCYIEFLDMFKEKWEQISDIEPIAFYGFSDGFAHMSQKVKINSKNVICIIENDTAFHTKNSLEADKIPVIGIENINEYKFNKIILTGFASRHQMRQDIAQYDENIEIIDIYAILERNGFKYDQSFFLASSWFDPYLKLELVRMAYKNSLNRKEMQKNLRLLIQTYLECRDFVYADYYVQEYIDGKYNDSDSFIELKNELNQFLIKIKENIKALRNKNVFVFVLDSFSYDMAKKAAFIKRFSQNNLSFHNTFAPGLHTRLSTLAFLTGKNCVEDELYKIAFLKKEDSDLISEMKSRGWKFKHISVNYFTFLQKINDYDSNKIHGVEQPLLYWSMLREVVSESFNCIYFIHNMEAHCPFYSGHPSKVLLSSSSIHPSGKFAPNFEGTPDEISRKYYEHEKSLLEDAVEYTDKQLDFYISLLNLDKDAVIITSDHQENFADSSNIEMHKTPLIIHSKSAIPDIHEDIYSTIDISNLLCQLIRGDQQLKITSMEYARQESEPYYGKDLKRGRTYFGLYGLSRFITKTEIYVFYYDGTEEYYLLPDMETNVIENERYKERINYFRTQISIDTRDVWRFMFDKYPHLLEVHKDRVEEFLNENKNPGRLISGKH